MNDSSPPLEIPQAAYRAAIEAVTALDLDDLGPVAATDAALEASSAAAPLIVAAELRRLADELDVVREEMREVDDRTIRSSGLGEGIQRIRARAAELDPQDGAA